MTPELHPNAAKNFEEKERVPLAAVAPESPQEPSEPPTDMFSPGGHVVATFGEEDYGEFKITGKDDRLGRTNARYFEHEDRRLGFEDEKYQALARLSESVQKTKAFCATTLTSSWHDLVAAAREGSYDMQRGAWMACERCSGTGRVLGYLYPKLNRRSR